jgi:Flp pilus assembly pilin Flp
MAMTDDVSRRLAARLRQLGSSEGIAVTEYGMLIAFLAIVLIAVVVILGGGLSNWFADKTAQITTN